MTGFVLKFIAMCSMVLDHIKYAVPATNNFITQYFGRLAFPIFAFLISEGMIHTKSRKKYILRMFIFACISQVPFLLFRGLVSQGFVLNVMFTFLFAIIGITIFDYFDITKEFPNFLKFIMTALVAISILLMTLAVRMDYGWYGIATVWLFYVLKDKKILRTIGYIILVILYYFSRYIGFINKMDWISLAFASLPAIIILFYNGKQGRKLKYFFYLFYPVHMLVLYGLSFIF